MKTWDEKYFLKNLSTDYLAKFGNDPEKVRTFIERLANRFGPLKKFGECNGESKIEYFTKGKISTVTGTYFGDVECAKGKAKVMLRIEHLDEKWVIREFDLQ